MRWDISTHRGEIHTRFLAATPQGTEQISVMLTLQAPISGVLGSNVCLDIGHPD
jgi:hypothetical protein